MKVRVEGEIDEKGRTVDVIVSNLASPLLLASTVSALTLPELLPIIPRPTVSSSIPTSSSALPNSIRFWSLRSSVWAYASFCFRALWTWRQLSPIVPEHVRAAEPEPSWRCVLDVLDYSPFPTSLLAVRLLGDGQCLGNLVGRGFRHPLYLLLQLPKALSPVTPVSRSLARVNPRGQRDFR